MITKNKIKAQKISDEATRYINNAYKELQQAKKDGEIYEDIKHVRIACGTAYLAMIKALDGIFLLRNIPKPKKRASIEYYQMGLAKVDKKLLNSLNIGYQILHLYGYYDGFNDVKTLNSGFEKAEQIILKLNQSI